MQGSADRLYRTLLGSLLLAAAVHAAHADQTSTKNLARGKKFCLNPELVPGTMTVSGSASDEAGNPAGVEWSVWVSSESRERGGAVVRTEPTAAIDQTVHVNGAYARACVTNPTASTVKVSLSQRSE